MTGSPTALPGRLRGVSRGLAAVACVLVLSLGGCTEEVPVSATSSSSSESPGTDLRHMVLTTTAEDLGFASDADYPEAYGVLVDWPLDDQVATILAMRDGTASLYTTSTFGILGGQAHESVRRTAEACVKTAGLHAASGEAVVDYPYPAPGQVFYYLLTYDGVRRVVGDESALEQGSDPTFDLFAAGQDVLTELRSVTEGQGAGQ